MEEEKEGGTRNEGGREGDKIIREKRSRERGGGRERRQEDKRGGVWGEDGNKYGTRKCTV